MATFDKIINPTDANVSFISMNNLGQTCYLNSALQFILSIPELINSIVKVELTTPYTNKTDAVAYELIRGLHSLYLVKYKSSKPHETVRLIWEPRNLLKSFIEYNPQFAFNEQHDASEAVSIMFDILEKSSYTKDIWLGSIAPHITFRRTQHCVCSGCNTDSISVDNINHLCVNLPENNEITVNITQLVLEEQSNKEIIEGYRCDVCKTSTNKCTKYYTYENSEKYLIVLLSRFNADMTKKKNKVIFSQNVKFTNRLYQPKSIISHHGANRMGGHYTTSIFPKYIIDDEKIRVFENFPEIYMKNDAYIFLLEIDRCPVP